MSNNPKTPETIHLNDLVLSRRQIEVVKAGERFANGGFGKVGSRIAEKRYTRFKCYIYRKYPLEAQ